MKTIIEPAQEINVVYEADVIVVGGGPGGIGAAVSAARSGAKTVLLERHNYLGGMGTGGMVTMFPHMTGGTDVLMPGGLMADVIKEMDALDGTYHPPKELWGSTDPEQVKRWRKEGMWFVSDEGRIRMTMYHDAELLKCVYNRIVKEAGIVGMGGATFPTHVKLSPPADKKIDYVIIHELSHIIHFNHSKNFWDLVSKYCSNYKEIRKEMKE